MFYSIPPVGNTISLCQANASFPDNINNFLNAVALYDSGTMALASALLAVKQRAKKSQSEVILPAYACPDLISAVLYADLKPVLVDFEKNKPWMDLSLLADKINDNTIAVLAVNLYGIPERTKEIKLLLKNTTIAFIEDSAQLFTLDTQQYDYQGDLVIFSFGRGKPVSILNGGAVWCKNQEYCSSLVDNKHEKYEVKMSPLFTIKVILYNLLISPYIYWLPENMPFLNLGQTVFKPLTGIHGFNSALENMLKCNIDKYLNIGLDNQKKIQSSFAQFKNETLLDLYADAGTETKLLRYPVLLPSKLIKEKLYALLSNKGVSRSYPQSLPNVEGLEFLKKQGGFPVAENFSERVLTFPVHQGVNSIDVESINSIIVQSKLV